MNSIKIKVLVAIASGLLCVSLAVIGKAAAFKKHMKIPLDEFLVMFDNYIRQPNEMVMKIFQKPNNETNE